MVVLSSRLNGFGLIVRILSENEHTDYQEGISLELKAPDSFDSIPTDKTDCHRNAYRSCRIIVV